MRFRTGAWVLAVGRCSFGLADCLAAKGDEPLSQAASALVGETRTIVEVFFATRWGRDHS